MRKTATALTGVALLAGTVLAASPASAATDQPWAESTATVETVSDTFYFRGEPHNPLRFPIKVNTNIDISSPAGFWGDSNPTVRAAGFDLPAGVTMPYPYTGSGTSYDSIDGEPGGVKALADLDGSNYGVNVTATNPAERHAAGGATHIKVTSYDGLEFSAPGTYNIGNRVIAVKPWAATIEPGSGWTDGTGARAYVATDLNPMNTQEEFGAAPTYSLALTTAITSQECAPIQVAYHKADGTVTPINIDDADSCTSIIPLDQAAFRDSAGNLIPGVLRYEFPRIEGSGYITVMNNSSWSRRPAVTHSTTEGTGTPPVGNPIEVTATAPTVAYDETCENPGVVTFPDIEGIAYEESGRDHASVVFAVRALDGYVLAPDSPRTFLVNLFSEECGAPAPASPSIDVPAEVLATALNEGVEFPFSGFPPNTEITFEFRSGDDVLSTSTVVSDENGEGFVGVFARLSDGSNVPNGTPFTIAASGDGFDPLSMDFTAVDALTPPVDPGTEPGTGEDKGGELARTGLDSQGTMLIVGGGAAALIAGAALLALRRRQAE